VGCFALLCFAGAGVGSSESRFIVIFAVFCVLMVDWMFGFLFSAFASLLVVDSAEPSVFPPSHPPEATTFANPRFIELQFVSQKSVKRQHLHVSADVAGSRLQPEGQFLGPAPWGMLRACGVRKGCQWRVLCGAGEAVHALRVVAGEGRGGSQLAPSLSWRSLARQARFV
jgi:hypothetical protein